MDVKDMGLYHKAIKQRWPVRDETKLKIVQLAETTLDNQEAALKDKMSAARMVVNIDRLNMEDERLHTPNVNINVNVKALSNDELEQRIRDIERELLAGSGTLTNIARAETIAASREAEETEPSDQSLPAGQYSGPRPAELPLI